MISDRLKVHRGGLAAAVDLELELEPVALVEVGMPARSTAEMWTNASGWPSSRWMKPKPFIALKNLTVPLAFSPVS